MPCSCEGQEAWLPTCPPHTVTNELTATGAKPLHHHGIPPTGSLAGRVRAIIAEDNASYSTQSPKYIGRGSQLRGCFGSCGGNSIKTKKALLLPGLAL